MTADKPTNTLIVFGPSELISTMGDMVKALCGPTAQPPFDPLINKAFQTAAPQNKTVGDDIRYIYPLKARSECLRCHINAQLGNVLGVIEVKQPLSPLIGREPWRTSFMPL